MNDTPRQIADSVWLYPSDASNGRVQPNIGIITAESASVLVDAGNSPRHARSITRSLALLGAPMVSYVIYTHHHWDHVFGAQVYVAPAIAHELCYDLLVERAAHPWSYSYVEEEIRRNSPQAVMFRNIQREVDDWHGFHIVIPTLTFTTTMTLYMGDLSLELEHVGGQHAPDSIVVKVLPAGVAFLGDCYYKPVAWQRTPTSTTDYDLIRRLLDDERIHTFIDGHTPAPMRREDFARLLE